MDAGNIINGQIDVPVHPVSAAAESTTSVDTAERQASPTTANRCTSHTVPAAREASTGRDKSRKHGGEHSKDNGRTPFSRTTVRRGRMFAAALVEKPRNIHAQMPVQTFSKRRRRLQKEMTPSNRRETGVKSIYVYARRPPKTPFRALRKWYLRRFQNV